MFGNGGGGGVRPSFPVRRPDGRNPIARAVAEERVPPGRRSRVVRRHPRPADDGRIGRVPRGAWFRPSKREALLRARRTLTSHRRTRRLDRRRTRATPNLGTTGAPRPTGSEIVQPGG